MINKKSPFTLGLQMSPSAWHNFRVDFLASAMYSLFNVVFNQFYMPMALHQGISDFQVGILAAAPAIGLLFSPIWASIVERSSPKWFTIVPNLIARSLIILPAFFGYPIVFVMTALAFHFLNGVQAPAYASLMTRIYPAQYRGRLMGYVRVVMGLLMIPLAFVVGVWFDASGPSGPLLLAAITGSLSILALVTVRQTEGAPATPSPAAGAKRASIREQWQLVKHNRNLAVFLAATTFTGFGNILAQPLYQIVQVNHLELGGLELGIARTAYFACLLTAYFVIGRAIDRFQPAQILIYGLVAYATVALLYGLAESFPTVIAASGIQGIGDAIWDIGILAYVFRIAPGREAVVFGLHLMLFGIRGTIGPLASTGLADVLPFQVMLLSASLFGWIGAAVFWWGNRKHTQVQAG